MLARNLKNPRAADPELDRKSLASLGIVSPRDSSATGNSGSLLQLRVLRLGFLQDGDVGVGVFPEGEEVLVNRARLGGVALKRVGAG